MSSKTCPIVAECRDVVQGIAQGDFKKVTVNGGILSLYTLSAAAQSSNLKVTMS